MRFVLVLLALVVTLTVAGSSPAGSLATEVVHWSPLDATGAVQSRFAIQPLGKGECVGRSATIGALGYRCKAGRWVVDPCWRSGDGVACVGFPWDDVVSTIRVPRSWFATRAPHSDPRVRPWALELSDGHRCRALQSSHVTVMLRGRAVAVQYNCDDGLVLLRNLTRGRVWRIATARWDHGRYAVDPGAIVRRAYFG